MHSAPRGGPTEKRLAEKHVFFLLHNISLCIFNAAWPPQCVHCRCISQWNTRRTNGMRKTHFHRLSKHIHNLNLNYSVVASATVRNTKAKQWRRSRQLLREFQTWKQMCFLLWRHGEHKTSLETQRERQRDTMIVDRGGWRNMFVLLITANPILMKSCNYRWTLMMCLLSYCVHESESKVQSAINNENNNIVKQSCATDSLCANRIHGICNGYRV